RDRGLDLRLGAAAALTGRVPAEGGQRLTAATFHFVVYPAHFGSSTRRTQRASQCWLRPPTLVKGPSQNLRFHGEHAAIRTPREGAPPGRPHRFTGNIRSPQRLARRDPRPTGPPIGDDARPLQDRDPGARAPIPARAAQPQRRDPLDRPPIPVPGLRGLTHRQPPIPDEKTHRALGRRRGASETTGDHPVARPPPPPVPTPRRREPAGRAPGGRPPGTGSAGVERRAGIPSPTARPRAGPTPAHLHPTPDPRSGR